MSFQCLLLLFAIVAVHSYDCHFTEDDDDDGDDNVGKTELIRPFCHTVCPIEFKGSCRCYLIGGTGPESSPGPVASTATAATGSQQKPIRLECSLTNASILMADIDNLNQQCNFNLMELWIKDSNLTHLYNLPSGLYNIQTLVLDNTGIDLETIRESHELLKSLKVLRISNENFTEIPEMLFNGMEELKELSLNRLGMAYINVEPFIPLQDSLTLLELRSNRIRTLPTAVQTLSHLECLDLTGNNIKSVSDSNRVIFSTGLKRLKRLRINPMNCSCEIGKSKFVTWLRTYAIKGVRCRWPERLMDKDVSNMPIEEFCEPWPSDAARNRTQPDAVLFMLAMLILITVTLTNVFIWSFESLTISTATSTAAGYNQSGTGPLPMASKVIIKIHQLGNYHHHHHNRHQPLCPNARI